MKTMIRGALAATALGAASVSALAADLPSIKEPPPPPPVFDTYQPFQVRLKLAGVVPTNGQGTTYDSGWFTTGGGLSGPLGPFLTPVGGSVGLLTGLSAGPGTVVPGASTSTSWSIIPMLDVAYYLTKNWAVEAICCVTQHHIQGTGTIQSEFAHAWLFPPSLLFQYHFTNFGAFQPYLGVGVNFTTYWGVRVNSAQAWPLYFAGGSPLVNIGQNFGVAQFQGAQVTPSWGVVGQVGFDYMFNEHWGLNVDIKYIQMDPTVHAQVVAFLPAAAPVGPIIAPTTVHLPIDPLVVSAGLTYRFGAGVVPPVVAKY